jgi:hypothetical protein
MLVISHHFWAINIATYTSHHLIIVGKIAQFNGTQSLMALSAWTRLDMSENVATKCNGL